MEITGFILNPYMVNKISEFGIFFKDFINVNAFYSKTNNKLTIEYYFIDPEFKRGYGVRVADTKIDPIAQILAIKRELKHYGLLSYLLIASDQKTVVLESPFFSTKDEAVEYIDSLENVGYKGKLAIREYKDFPRVHRFEVVSEVVITEENSLNLENIVYSEFLPGKVYQLGYPEIFLISKDIFSPKVQKDEKRITEYYYKLSDIYRNYKTDDDHTKRLASLVAIKFLEIIYVYYPETKLADESLWDIANIIRKSGTGDVIDEESCYERIISEYPKSLFIEDAKTRIEEFKNRDIYMLLNRKGLKDH